MVTLLAAAKNQIGQFKNDKGTGPSKLFCKDFWDRSRGRAIQLLASLLAISPVTVQEVLAKVNSAQFPCF